MGKTEAEKVQGKIDGFFKNYTDKKIFSMHVKDSDKAPVKHEIGETWTDKDGKEWVQKDGYRMRIDAVLGASKLTCCPDCKKFPKSRADKKMMRIHNMCLDCVAEFETQIKIAGKWKEYERNKIKENIRSYIKDAEQQTAEFIESLDKGVSILNVANEDLKSIEFEQWHQDKEAVVEQKEKAIDTLKMMHDDFEKSFGEKVHNE